MRNRAQNSTLCSGERGSLLIGIHAWSQLSLYVRVVTAPLPLTSTSPHPHQLAYGQDGQLKGFAVLEYETAEMAEEVQQEADGLALGGSHLRISFCAPGPPGRSMLAALIAAQATVSVCPGSGNGKLGARPSSLEKSGLLVITTQVLGAIGKEEASPLWPGRALSHHHFLSSGPQSRQRAPA